jgi:hypothetical protein
MQIPCGKCAACRVNKTTEWALRALHEAGEYEHSLFWTLTYRPDDLPRDGGLHHRDFQLFIKRLRAANQGKKIRYIMCGEYGSNPGTQPRHATHVTPAIINKEARVLGRPHFHAAIFGYLPPDLKPVDGWSNKGKDYIYYQSDIGDSLWEKGNVIIGSLTPESAAYICRYTMKKLGGTLALNHYEKVNLDTGEIFKIKPEYVRSSTRPGIGKAWFTRYKKQLKEGYIINTKGKRIKTPKYYDNIIDIINPDLAAAIKKERQELAKANPRTSDQLRQSEEILKRRLSKLKRDKQ